MKSTSKFLDNRAVVPPVPPFVPLHEIMQGWPNCFNKRTGGMGMKRLPPKIREREKYIRLGLITESEKLSDPKVQKRIRHYKRRFRGR